MEIFREAMRSEAEEAPSLHYRAQQTVALARAVCDTLSAEKKLALEHIHAAKVYLQVSRDVAEAVDTRKVLADEQLGRILASKESKSFPKSRHDIYNFRPRQYRPDNYAPPPSDSDDSELESYYSGSEPDQQRDIDDDK